MLKKRFRLTKRDFLRLKSAKKRRVNGAYFVFVCAAGIQPYSRISVSLGSAVERKAVERNRLRRRILEVIRLNYHAVPQGSDCIVIPKVSARGKQTALLKKDLLDLFSRAAKSEKSSLSRMASSD